MILPQTLLTTCSVYFAREGKDAYKAHDFTCY